jgi:diadenosine tetraphosphate (Ap4A) HIT family hydrolase
MISNIRDIILSGSSECVEELFSHMEALEHIDCEMKKEEVWDRNKVPYMTREEAEHVCAKGCIIEIPDWMAYEPKAFITYCHGIGFEPGEFLTGKVFDTSEEECFLCDMGRHVGFVSLTGYNQHVPDQVDMIIYESPNFYVTSELGALKYGYLMIVPKAHILSVAQFPPELFPEYEEVCRDVEVLLKATYGWEKKVTFWEHGSGPSGLTAHKKSIVHAHTHVVVDFTLAEKYLRMVQMKPCPDITVARNTHYFSYQEGTGGQLLCCMDPNVYVQRQYPRQIMAMELGLAPNQYNWRGNKFFGNVKATLYHIFSCLKSNKSWGLPQRLIERTRAFVDAYPMRDDVKNPPHDEGDDN